MDELVANIEFSELLLKQSDYQQLLSNLPAHSWQLSTRQLCDIELLLNDGFAPLSSFMGQADYTACVNEMRLADGTLWSIPVVLDVDAAFVQKIGDDEAIVLRDGEGFAIAVLTITEIWQADKSHEAQQVYGTTSEHHPGAAYVMQHTHPYYVSGSLLGIRLPRHYDFTALRLTPADLKQYFDQMGWERVVGFQTRNPIHKAHFELTRCAAASLQAGLLLHPAVGETMPGDIDPFTRIRCYQHILPNYPESTKLGLLPLAMRMAGPREALWHAIIRRNYGCTHFIVGRDHAGPSHQGQAFYEPYAAQELLVQYQDEVGIKAVALEEMVYSKHKKDYVKISEVKDSNEIEKLSGTELRKRLRAGEAIPEWYSFPEVVTELQRAVPARTQQGVGILFTGLPCSGKSTLANALKIKLLEKGGRTVSVLDGDVVRQLLSSGLGFSPEDRALNLKRIGFVASEVVKHGGIVLCALVSPYERDRQILQHQVRQQGGFVEVHVATAVDVCESRDGKGYYRQARAGQIKNFTGVSAPYEVPDSADITVDMAAESIEEAVQKIVLNLIQLGYLSK